MIESAYPTPATAATATDPSIAALAAFARDHRRLFVLGGAGCSTGSGIPDYRDAAGAWKRRQPVTYQAFMNEPATRARYWARSMIGWPVISGAKPNDAHRALARLERQGRLELLVTQNVDGLHEAAGHRHVIDLHGRIDRIVCMNCRDLTTRSALQDRLLQLNPEWAHLTAATAPDGDADLDALDFSAFQVPECAGCGGRLKPDVVFFGENVPVERVQESMAAVHNADAMLVVGSSLMVYSGYRFAKAAADRGIPIAAVNLGVTRADDLLALKVERSCGEALMEALELL